MAASTRQQSELPPLLMTSEPGSFARETIVERKPQIIRQVIEDNHYPARTVERLESFRIEIASELIRPLQERAPDVGFWNGELSAHQGRTWLEVPWFFAETYFYRRLLEAVDYFQPGPWERHDPFGRQKRVQIEGAVARLAEDWPALVEAGPDLAFEALLHSCLWGNRADLSNYTVRLAVRGGLGAREERHNILIDHTEQVHHYVAGGYPSFQDVLHGLPGLSRGGSDRPGLRRVDFVNDNVGLELLFDLALADLLLRLGWAEQVVFHLKNHPFFVSDTMPSDVQATIALLIAAADTALSALGQRLEGYLAAARLVLSFDPFWTMCLMFCQFPLALGAELARSDLVILKGDVNYRRLLGDRHWPHTTRLREVAADFPAPFLALRTLKSEILVGLAPGQAEALSAEDPTWLINGQRGLIHFCWPGAESQPRGSAAAGRQSDAAGPQPDRFPESPQDHPLLS